MLDSGASFHATSQKEFFERYIPENLRKVYLGDDQPCDIIGKGVVKIKLIGSIWELNDVRHIPDLRKTLSQYASWLAKATLQFSIVILGRFQRS